MAVSFGSDNHSGVHPHILAALYAANEGHAHSYGLDPWTLQLDQVWRERFGCDVRAFYVFNGTAANVVALRGLVRPWESVLCTDVSHLVEDECGAPEVMGGFKLVPVPSVQGHFKMEVLETMIRRLGDQHYSQPRVVSVTLPTEYGTVGTAESLYHLREFCDRHRLLLHIDGARLVNGMTFLGWNFKDLYTHLRPDAISLGGTKNGLLFGECILIFSKDLYESYKYLRKQSMQLPSKGRFVAAQFLAYLENDLCFEISRNVHSRAKELAQGLSALGLNPEYPVESNAVFVRLPRDKESQAKKQSFFYIWDEQTRLARLMCSFDVTSEDIRQFLEVLR